MEFVGESAGEAEGEFVADGRGAFCCVAARVSSWMDPLVLMVPGEGVARLYWCIFVEPAGPDLRKGLAAVVCTSTFSSKVK